MKTVLGMRNACSVAYFAAALWLVLPVTAAAQDKIAFSSTRDGSSEIYLMNPNGTNQTRLTNNTTNDFAPALSRDGSRIAFMARRDGNDEIYVMNADGSNQTRLTNNSSIDDTPSFSPDGTRIVFESHRDGNSEVYVMNADGSNPVRLTNNPTFDRNPAFSPDGNRIVFESNRDGNMEIYVMNSDGTNQTRLTFFAPANDHLPSFSPDGNRITFTSTRELQSEIYVMNVDGSNLVRLTNDPAEDTSSTFSSDGSRIAFVSGRNGAGNTEIYVMDADGSDETQLTFTSPFDEASPSWGGLAPGSSPPVLSNLAVTTPINENSSAMLSGSIGSPIAGNSFALSVDWGDGSPVQNFNYPAGTTSFNATHQYLDDNPTTTPSDTYTINLTLTTTGGSDTDTIAVTVNNVAPTAGNLALSPSPAVGGSPATLTGTVSDVGSLDAQTIVIDWGDSSPDTTLNLTAGTSDFSAEHTYNALGDFTITVTATDDDGGTDSQALNINITPPPPPAAPTNLRVSSVGANQVTLAWTDNANNESGFVIQQCHNKTCSNSVVLGETGANVTTFTHTGLLANTSYLYRVKAVNLGGSSGYSNTVTGRTLRK